MSDLISRQALCEYALNQKDKSVTPNDIMRFPSAQPEQQWVLVKEKLPEEDKDVLVTVHFLGLEQKHKSGWNDHIKPSYYVDIASHIDGEWSSASDEYKVARNRHIVIAWKELPDPYREEGENG